MQGFILIHWFSEMIFFHSLYFLATHWFLISLLLPTLFIHLLSLFSWRIANCLSNKLIRGNMLLKFPRYAFGERQKRIEFFFFLFFVSCFSTCSGNLCFFFLQLPNTEVWFQRPKDIVRKLLSGDLDLGIVGLDIVGEFGQVNDITILAFTCWDSKIS